MQREEQNIRGKSMSVLLKEGSNDWKGEKQRRGKKKKSQNTECLGL